LDKIQRSDTGESKIRNYKKNLKFGNRYSRSAIRSPQLAIRSLCYLLAAQRTAESQPEAGRPLAGAQRDITQ
jgi:hypothetical protein